jgi:hypothetical protein
VEEERVCQLRWHLAVLLRPAEKNKAAAAAAAAAAAGGESMWTVRHAVSRLQDKRE